MSAVHAARYPIHKDPAKGQVYGGECNRTACERHGAVWWNMGTYGFYCTQDAHLINGNPPSGMSPLCIKLDAHPETIEEMERLRREHGYFGDKR